MFPYFSRKMSAKRAIRIGNVSGATGDAPHAMLRMAQSGNVDVITGDWLSEMNIAWNAIAKAQNPDAGFEQGFLDQLEESIDTLVSKKIKVVTNAGALNTISLTNKVYELCVRKGYEHLKIASILGDDVTAKVQNGQNSTTIKHLDHEATLLQDWEKDLTPTCAVAYIGAWGIVEALKHGADVVICGRVTDASPVVSIVGLLPTAKTNHIDWSCCLVAWLERDFLQGASWSFGCRT
jgi:hypothetical protein